MTDNDAEKALDDIVTAYCMLLGMDPPIPDPLSQTAEQVKLIRIKLAKSAKVDGLLDALKECDEAMEYMSEYDIPIGLPDRVKQAIQSFNGEV